MICVAPLMNPHLSSSPSGVRPQPAPLAAVADSLLDMVSIDHFFFCGAQHHQQSVGIALMFTLHKRSRW
jgi:hypothetical protein